MLWSIHHVWWINITTASVSSLATVTDSVSSALIAVLTINVSVSPSACKLFIPHSFSLISCDLFFLFERNSDFFEETYSLKQLHLTHLLNYLGVMVAFGHFVDPSLLYPSNTKCRLLLFIYFWVIYSMKLSANSLYSPRNSEKSRAEQKPKTF